MKNEILYVQLLGKIELKNSKGVVTRQTLHSGRITHLLLYFLLHRKEELTMQRLCDILWKEGTSENPTGALKNLMYRLRSALKILGNQEFILTGSASYRWNPEISVVSDFDIFESKYKSASDISLTEEERIQNVKEAFELYKGRLPENLLAEKWALPIDTYYLSIYQDVVKILAEDYFKRDDFQNAEQIATKGLRYVGYDEELHCYVIESLMKQGKEALAMSYYNKAIKQYHEQQGSKSRNKLDDLYKRVVAVNSQKKETIVQVAKALSEEDPQEGVFMCEYGSFKRIYSLERRRIERTGEPEFLLLLTLTKRDGSHDMDIEVQNKMMARVEAAIVGLLRKGDAATRYSDNQYVILLINCNPEAAEKVAERIVKSFRKRARAPYVKLSFELCKVKGMSKEEEMMLENR